MDDQMDIDDAQQSTLEQDFLDQFLEDDPIIEPEPDQSKESDQPLESEESIVTAVAAVGEEVKEEETIGTTGAIVNGQSLEKAEEVEEEAEITTTQVEPEDGGDMNKSQLLDTIEPTESKDNEYGGAATPERVETPQEEQPEEKREEVEEEKKSQLDNAIKRIRISKHLSAKERQKPLLQLLNESHQLYAETRVYPDEEDDSKHEIEFSIVRRMREYRRKIAKEYGPYAEIDLEELLNPADRLESIILKSSKSHALNNLHLEALAKNISALIESEHETIKVLYRIASIIQGDDPKWQNVDFEQYKGINNTRNVVQQYLNNDILFVEKMQDIRDKLTFIQARKKEFLCSLKERFSPIYPPV